MFDFHHFQWLAAIENGGTSMCAESLTKSELPWPLTASDSSEMRIALTEARQSTDRPPPLPSSIEVHIRNDALNSFGHASI
jgi:hypothetical protein